MNEDAESRAPLTTYKEEVYRLTVQEVMQMANINVPANGNVESSINADKSIITIRIKSSS